MNKKKEEKWSQLSEEDKHVYQNDVAARSVEGNKRLDFRFAY